MGALPRVTTRFFSKSPVLILSPSSFVPLISDCRLIAACCLMTFAPFLSASFTGPPLFDTISGGRDFKVSSTPSNPLMLISTFKALDPLHGLAEPDCLQGRAEVLLPVLLSATGSVHPAWLQCDPTDSVCNLHWDIVGRTSFCTS